jgi:hypothetical protein
MFEHTDEQLEKRELMRVLARALIKIDRGEIDNVSYERIGGARDGIVKVLEMLKGNAGPPEIVSTELRKACHSLGVKKFQNPEDSAQRDLARAESLLTDLSRIK